MGKCATVVRWKLLNETQIQKTEAAILAYLLKNVLVVQLDWQGCHCEIVCYLSFLLNISSFKFTLQFLVLNLTFLDLTAIKFTIQLFIHLP